jgi:hypothetical protein
VILVAARTGQRADVAEATRQLLVALGHEDWWSSSQTMSSTNMNTLFWNMSSWETAAQIAARARQNWAPWLSSGITTEIPLPLRAAADTAQLLLQTVIVPGARTSEGRLIQAVAIPWYEIIALLQKDPSVAFQISPEKWEEIIAGAYRKAGFDEVTLTPRSGDHGRDVIAIKNGLGSVRNYRPGQSVQAPQSR